MRFARLRLLLSAIMAICCSSLLAASKSGGLVPLFAQGAGARALAMGGVGVASAADPSSVFWNPATLASLSERDLSLMYLPLAEGSNYSFAAIGWPTVDYGSFAVGAFLLTTDKIERRDRSGAKAGEFSANQQMYLLGYGKSLGRFLSLGTTVKIYGQSIDNQASFGAGGDAGIHFRLSDNLSLGFNGQNLISPQIRLNRDSESLPLTLKAGAALSLPLFDGRHTLLLSGEVDKTQNVDPLFHGGIEWGVGSHYFLRGGYDIDQVTAGAGVRVGMISVGYSYRSQDFFSAQHRFVVDIALGGSVSSILAERREEQRRAAEEFGRAQRQRDLDAAQTQARYFFQNSLYDSAEVYYRKVAVLAGDSDTEASARLQSIEKGRSERLAANVRAGVLAETDSIKAEELFSELSEALKIGDLESATLSLQRLRPAFATDERFRRSEAAYHLALSDRIAQLQREASRLYADGNLAEAALRYDEILQYNASDAAAKRNLKSISDRILAFSSLRAGLAAYESGDTVAARQTFETMLAANPNDSLALSLLRRLQPESTAASTSLADIQRDSTTWKVYLDGIERFRSGRYDEAIKLWERVLEMYPGNPETEKNIQQAKLRLQPGGKTN